MSTTLQGKTRLTTTDVDRIHDMLTQLDCAENTIPGLLAGMASIADTVDHVPDDDDPDDVPNDDRLWHIVGLAEKDIVARLGQLRTSIAEWRMARTLQHYTAD